jgi:large repetitive protein
MKVTHINLTPMKFKNYLLFCFILLVGSNDLLGQNLKPFTKRFDRDVKGDMLIIGNNILNRRTNTEGPNVPYDDESVNSTFNMQYINVDGAAICSSRAVLDIPDPSGTNCFKIVYAGLYWGAILKDGNRTRINEVKLKLPTGGYNNITGQLIYDTELTPIGGDNSKPYACYADITALVTGLANPEGTYTVADVISSIGGNGGTGLSAGWSIFIVYEDPNLTSKAIVSFDGFSGIFDGNTLDIPITGFRTIPTGPVRAKYAFTALEGDRDIKEDYLEINGRRMSDTQRPTDNFFNSKITTPTGAFLNRTPNSLNTLGYDAGVINVNNPNNVTLANNATNATIRLGTDRDLYMFFFNAFAVDIIAPDIRLTKIVTNSGGTPIGGANVNLCQDLIYEIGFQNRGNDNATSFTIRDVIPVNVTFNPATDLVLVPGVTFVSYTPATREVVLRINNNLVEVGDPEYKIRLKVKVVCSCKELDDACSNVIRNQAFANYSGTFNTNVFNNGSFAGVAGCDLNPSSTNTLVGIPASCGLDAVPVVFCGTKVVLTAGDGFQTYTWTGPAGATITPVPTPPTAQNPTPAFNQSVEVNQAGIYTVVTTTTVSPCKGTTQTFDVKDFAGGVGVINPILPYNQNLTVPGGQPIPCPNNGIVVPHIYLCGANQDKVLNGTTVGAIKYTWQKLTAGCTPATPDFLCPYDPTPPLAAGCWADVGNAATYTVNSPGQYRLVLEFQGSCVRTFYFNVFQNLLLPIATHTDEICNTLGTITVTNVPTGYLYSLTAGGLGQASNVFTGLAAGNYTVYITQAGVVNGCVFTVSQSIRKRNFTVTTSITQPLCFGEQGSIKIAANDVEPWYNFALYTGNTATPPPLYNFGPSNTDNTYTFNGLSPGNYTYVVTTKDGCTETKTFTINNPPKLLVTAVLTKPLMPCSNGEVTIYPVGGTPPYNLIVNGVPTGNLVISVPNPGAIYNIQLVDANNCTAGTSITVTPNPVPTFTVTPTNIKCNGDRSGAILFNPIVPNPSSYTFAYSISGIAGPFLPNPNFTNLPAGTYTVAVQYTLGGVSCITPTQTVTITEPPTALTASGGVYQVACGTVGGTIRITNPQGGTPFPAPNFYQYNFYDGNGWVNTNIATNIPPGTRTISIRDDNGCIFDMVVTVDPPPAEPIITVSPATYSCTGNATTTVTVTNPVGFNYNYTYSINPALVPPHNSTSNVFTNVPCGPKTVTVNYELVNVTTFSNLLNETFGSGVNTTTPGIAAAYCWNSQPYPAGLPCGNAPVPGFPTTVCKNPDGTNSWFLNDNQYVVTSAINPNNCAWFPYRDHTSNGADPRGRFLAVNIGSAAGPNGILYSKPINSVIPNQPVKIELYVANLLVVGNGGADPDFLIELVDPTNTVISSSLVGVVDNTVNAWQLKQLSLNPGNNTNLTFRIRSGSIIYGGNDAALDDIRVFQLPITCIKDRVFPIDVPCNKAFEAKITGFTNPTCAGVNDATITIAAQNYTPAGYQYSWDNGTTWLPAVGILTPTVTLTVPAGYLGNIRVRYAGLPIQASCSFTLPQVITPPSPVTLTAVFTPPTCLQKSTITATAAGGNGGYLYTLTGTTNPGGVAVNIGPQNSNIFSPVAPGNYTVTVRDSKNCTSAAPFPVNIVAPVGPTATIGTLDLCYNGAPNTASIQVNVVGGTAPYQFILNGTPVTTTATVPYTFTNLNPGTYTITVTDALGCSTTLPAQIVAPQLTATGNIIKGLDCKIPPNAIIQGSVNGGTPGYTYTVNALGPFPITGGTFNYTGAATAGPYVFVITDSRGCTATFTTVISPLNPLTVTATSPTVIKCAGDSTGSIIVTPAGGSGTGYVINVVRTLPTNIVFGTQVNNLPAGTYTVTVTDSNSCTASTTVVITENPPITFTPTKIDKQCTAGGIVLGSISTGTITGGTATVASPYVVTLFNNSSGGLPQTLTTTGASVIFPNLIPGSYTLEVVDANNCKSVKVPVDLNEIVNGLIINTTQPPVDCVTGPRIIVSVQNPVVGNTYLFGIANGTNVAPYTNALLPSDPGIYDQHTFYVTASNTYTFVVYDTNSNCYFFQTSTSGAIPSSNMTAIVNTVACLPLPPGGINPIQFTVSGYNAGTTAVNYQIYIANTNTPVGPPGTLPIIPLGAINVTSPVINMPFAGNFYIQLIEQNPNPLLNGCSAGSGNFPTTAGPLVPLSLSVSSNVNATCNKPNAIVAVQGIGGGGAPYNFVAVPAGTLPAPTTGFGPSPLSLPVIGTGPTTYDVYVQDATGCVASIQVTVVKDPLPQIDSIILNNQCTSTGSFNFTVVASGGIGQLTYAITAPPAAVTPYQTGTTFTVNAPGTYTVAVQDANGCIVTGTTPIVIYPPIDATATFTQPLCNTNNGTITITASGGSGIANFTYAITPAGPTQVTNATGVVFSGVTTGLYSVTITDNITLCPKVVPVDIPVAIPVTFTANTTPVVCLTDANGTITVTLGAGNNDPVYTYSLTAGPGPLVYPINNGSSNVFTGLPAGTYTVLVTSGKGCFASDNNVVVGVPTPIVIPTPVIKETDCAVGTNSTSYATITIPTVPGPSGGAGAPYTYQFLDAGGLVLPSVNNVVTITNPLGGTITINVFDSAGCRATTTATVKPFVGILDPVVTVTRPITCALPENISVSVTTSNGSVIPLNYTINTIPAGGPGYPITLSNVSGPGVFTNLAIGDYEITVTNPATNCTVKTIHYVFNPNTLSATAIPATDVSCLNGTNGSVILTIVDNIPPDGAGAFSYVINNAAGTLVASGNSPNAGPFTTPVIPTGLAAGTYTAVLTLTSPTSSLCSATTTFTINGPQTALAVTATKTDITCIPGNDGTITASATGGWTTAPYEYQLLLGGVPVAGYDFATNGTNNVFINLAPSTPGNDYVVQVRDAKGCIASSAPITLAIPTPIAAVVTNAPIACIDALTTISIQTITGGSGVYTYIITNLDIPATSTTVTLPATGATIAGYAAGNYEVEIGDSWGCKTKYPLTILQPTKVVADLKTSLAPTCTVGATLVLTGSGGTPGVSPAPSYTYSTSATGPFTNAFPIGSNTVTIANQPPGVYTFYVQDSRGCISLISNEVIVPVITPVTVTPTLTQDVRCGGSATGALTVTAQGGVAGNFTYQLYTCAGVLVPTVPANNTTGVFPNLLAGCYVVRATSIVSADCNSSSPPINIFEPTPFVVKVSQTEVKCFGGRDGTITIETTGGTGVIAYALEPLSQGFINIPTPLSYVVQNVPAGTYQLVVQDQNGCFDARTIIMTEPTSPVSFTLDPNTVVNEQCLGDNNGAFTVINITGGTPLPTGYTATLYLGGTGGPIVQGPVPINGVSSHAFTGLAGGFYTVVINDANGCPFEREQEIKKGTDMAPEAILDLECTVTSPLVPIVNVTTVNKNNPPSYAFEPAGEYQFVLSGVNPPVAPSAPQSSPIFTSITHPMLATPGTFLITVTNTVTLCEKFTQTFQILASDLDPLEMNLTQVFLNQIVANTNNSLGQPSGTPPYTFVFDGENTGGNNIYVYDHSGTYVVTVTDSNDCTVTKQIPVIFIPIIIPDFFTPNGDGTNPTWSPLNTSNYKDLKTYIYDRYGRKVKELNEGEKWDGKYEGKELPSGDYWYVVKVNGNKDNSEYVGHFTLYR